MSSPTDKAGPLLSHRALIELALEPSQYLSGHLRDLPPPRELLAGFVVPLVAIRAVAVLLRALVEGAAFPGFLLAAGSFLLQIGTWLALSIVLTPLARQFNIEIDEHTSHGLMAYASVPLWIAGVLYLMPEDPTAIWLWSRGAVLLTASYGLYIFFEGARALGVEARQRAALTVAVGAAYVIVYGVLFALLGLSMFVILFLFGR